MSESPPWGLAWRSGTLFIVSTVGIGLFTDLFLYGLVVPILPFILSDRVHLPHGQIQSNVSGLLAAYAAASVAFSLPAGILADRLPTRRLPFLVGLVALLLATLLLLVGRTVAVLALARVLQGISAAVVWTVGLALILDTVGPGHLGKTIGSIFGFISIGELAAPVLGGVIYKKAGYGGVFGLGFALLALDFIMRLLIIEKKTARKYREHEDGGAAAASQEQDTTDEEQETEEDPLIRQKEEDYYVIPSGQSRAVRSFPILYCLTDPRLLTAELLSVVQAVLYGAFDATIPTVAEDYYGFDSLKSGLLFIALILPNMIMGPLAGWSVDRYGPKPAAVCGFGFLTPVIVLLRLAQPGGKVQIIIYCFVLALCGIGLGVIGSSSIVEASFIVQQYDKANPDYFSANGPYGQLYAINAMAFSLGLTIGPLISGSLRDALGYGDMNLAIAAFCLIAAALSFVYVGGKPAVLKGKYWRRST